MKLIFDENGLLHIDAPFISSDDYWHSKLAFRNRSTVKGDIKELVFSDKLVICPNENKWYIPKNLSEAEYCYLMRVVTDNYLLLKGMLPFHAAAVSNKENQFFIFSTSGGGKSYISEILCNLDDSFFIIGDDHVCHTDEYVFGNLRRRSRRNNEYIYSDNAGSDLKRNCTAVLFSYSDEEQKCSAIPPKTLMRRLGDASGLKYACSPFSLGDVTYDTNILTGFSALKYYENILQSDIFYCAIEITGTRKYAAECILSAAHREEIAQ